MTCPTWGVRDWSPSVDARGCQAHPSAVSTTLLIRNAWGLTLGPLLGRGVEPRGATPTEVVHDEPHRTLRRYVGPATSGRPVLLVPPLAVSTDCYDLRPGQSLAAHLADQRPAYVIDYGPITFADRGMGFEDWITDILPTAIRRVSEEHGGVDVDVIGWSLGGTLLYLTAAHDPSLPVAGLVALGTPVDYSKNPATALTQKIGRLTGGRLGSVPAVVLGGVPRHVVRGAFRATAPRRELTKPLYALRNLGDTEALARMQAVERFMGRMPGYPGRLYLQMYQRLVLRNELLSGTVRLNDELHVRLADLRARVLVVGSPSDALAPEPSVVAAVEVLTGAKEVVVATVAASHLGLVAGPDAPRTTWPVIDDFLR